MTFPDIHGSRASRTHRESDDPGTSYNTWPVVMSDGTSCYRSVSSLIWSLKWPSNCQAHFQDTAWPLSRTRATESKDTSCLCEGHDFFRYSRITCKSKTRESDDPGTSYNTWPVAMSDGTSCYRSVSSLIWSLKWPSNCQAHFQDTAWPLSRPGRQKARTQAAFVRGHDLLRYSRIRYKSNTQKIRWPWHVIQYLACGNVRRHFLLQVSIIINLIYQVAKQLPSSFPRHGMTTLKNQGDRKQWHKLPL